MLTKLPNQRKYFSVSFFLSNNYFRNFYHQSKFPCIIIIIIIIILFFSSFSTLLPVNLFVLFWRCFVMLNSYFVCFIIYIFFFNFEIFFVDIIFVPKIGVCFSFYPVSLIFEYVAKPHIRWPHIREYEAGESGANFTSVANRTIKAIFFPDETGVKSSIN